MTESLREGLHIVQTGKILFQSMFLRIKTINRLGAFRQKVTTLISYQNQRCWVADPKGFEPLTFWSVARRSIQLS